jgi:hypothetical protein
MALAITVAIFIGVPLGGILFLQFRLRLRHLGLRVPRAELMVQHEWTVNDVGDFVVLVDWIRKHQVQAFTVCPECSTVRGTEARCFGTTTTICTSTH